MKLSIIVPVYNVEDYLNRCLDSLVVQNVSDMEIIVVNDGSPDCSQKIIEEYEERFPFVKGFVKENGGLSDARNYGLSKASGEYIAFVDSDDYVEETMYETMLKKADEGGYDIVVCDFEEVYPFRVQSGCSRIEKDLLSKEAVKAHMNDIYPSAWNKIYKRELFETIRFKKNVWFEDVEMLYRMLPYVNSIGTVHQPFYKYIQREGSISKSNDRRIFHYLDNWNGILQYYKDHGLFEEYYHELEYNYVRYIYATFVKAAMKFEKNLYKTAVVEAIANVRDNFPKYRKNRYFYKTVKGWYLLLFNRGMAKLLYMFRK